MTWIILLALYLVVGFINFGFFAAGGGAMLTLKPLNRMAALLEACFFILLWPAQVLFTLAFRP